jgi:hypothetical protein
MNSKSETLIQSSQEKGSGEVQQFGIKLQTQVSGEPLLHKRIEEMLPGFSFEGVHADT